MTQQERDNLVQAEDMISAWMDGELEPAQSDDVAARAAADPDWQALYRQFMAVNAALDALPPATPPADLAERILAATRQTHRPARLVRWLAPAAAIAAAAVIGISLWLNPTRTGPVKPETPEQPAIFAQYLPGIAPDDQYIVANLPLFQDYTDVAQYEKVRSVADPRTLSALEDLERHGDL